MSKLDLNALNELPKVDRILALAETNAQLEKLDAEGRVAWALDNLPGCIDSLEVRKKPGGHWIIRDLMGLDLVGLASL